MNYIELKCEIEPYDSDISEILMAELSELEFESFVEEGGYLLAYVQEDRFNEKTVDSLQILSNKDFKIIFSHKIIEQENWNETWEKNYFEPIVIENKCVIRSSFHPELPDIEYQITIDPKMAFGTGHHETTSLMIKEILQLDLEEKTILDMGCGTGILAILSSLKNAKNILARDIDKWSYENTIENNNLNDIKNIEVLEGDISVVDANKEFDIIYANINKNVLLSDINFYSKKLKNEGYLLLSGFYQSDFKDIDEIAVENGLKLKKKDANNNWMMLKYKKV